MMNKLEFYYDCSSPWTYLAFEQVCRLGDVLEISWKPILVGGILIVSTQVCMQRGRTQFKLN